MADGFGGIYFNTIILLAVVLLRQEFGGNSDRNTARNHYFSSPFVARYIRFHPVEWHKRISMRAGLIGCPRFGKRLAIVKAVECALCRKCSLVSRNILSCMF